MLTLSFGIDFYDLYDTRGLKRLDEVFLQWLQDKDANGSSHVATPTMYDELIRKRGSGEELSDQQLIDLSVILEGFLAELFGIKDDLTKANAKLHDLSQILRCRKMFIQKMVLRRAVISDNRLQAALNTLGGKGLSDPSNEREFAQFVLHWLDCQDDEALDAAAIYGNYLIFGINFNGANNNEQKKYREKSILFSIPGKVDYANLIPELHSKEKCGANDDGRAGSRESFLPSHLLHGRDNFGFYDLEKTLEQAQKQASYCIYCHNRQKDSCAHGFISKDTGKAVTNPLGIEMHGCPLKEKISEMNWLRANGYTIAPLVVAALDNPMLAATGHRICNDCMKACIYQKQEPVNIPMVETQTLDQVLALPWGFEIYSLLTRWNPLNTKQPLPLDDNNRKVLIVGLGPAGFTLAHYLLNSGVIVVGIDGTKIEGLSPELVGRGSGRLSSKSSADGLDTIKGWDDGRYFIPIRDVSDLFVNLADRVPQGFGGVMEYGITVRWQKNYLTIIRLLLERRENFRLFGGVRFGSQIDFDNAKSLGFDHIALAMGAGKPNLPKMENNLARGVRTASDFLMALQLTGAGRHDSLANLQLRMPIVVIGSGLTAVDTATESLAYYCVQIEKFLQRYEFLGDRIFSGLTEEEREIAEEFIKHGKELRAVKSVTASKFVAQSTDLTNRNGEDGSENGKGRSIAELLRSWGGATILYRKSIQSSPAYRINHEEMTRGFEQGFYFVDSAVPIAIETNNFGHCVGVHYTNADGINELGDSKFNSRIFAGSDDALSSKQHLAKLSYIDAKAVIIAIGTEPNTAIVREDESLTNGLLKMDSNGKYFAFIEGRSFLIHTLSASVPTVGISCFGDLHPKYAGNVVKAMASAKDGYSEVLHDLSLKTGDLEGNREEFFLDLENKLIAIIEKVNVLAEKIIELVIRSPLASQKFKPGQFFRLQNYTTSKVPLMEGIALTGANCDGGTISLILLEMGGSTSLCRYLEVGEKVVLMGPTGSPTEIPKNENVLLIGGGLGNAVLFSIGKAMKDNGCNILYFAGYRSPDDCYKSGEIEMASDLVVWCCDNGLLDINRETDISMQGTIIECLQKYAETINCVEQERSVLSYSASTFDHVKSTCSHPDDWGDVALYDRSEVDRSGFNTQDPKINRAVGQREKAYKEINRIIVIGSVGLMNAVTKWRYSEVGRELFRPECKLIASINSPMQCMMKEICGQCLQRHIDENGKESYIYSCFSQDQNCAEVDFCFLQQRLKQNSLQEKVTAHIQSLSSH